MTTWNNNQINLNAIRKLYKSNPAAKAAFDYFATKKRNQRATKLFRLFRVLVARGHNVVTYPDVRNFLRELDRLKCGNYKIGRRGQPSRLQWNVGLISLGQVASGQLSKIEELKEEEIVEDNDDTDVQSNGVSGPNDMKLSYPLRRDRHVDLILPKDITPVEAQRLADFIKTLQFE